MFTEVQADVGGEGEAGRDGDPEAGHLRQTRALATEDFFGGAAA